MTDVIYLVLAASEAAKIDRVNLVRDTYASEYWLPAFRICAQRVPILGKSHTYLTLSAIPDSP
jgi:hypothetical protein